jgi:dihydrofolate reductase
MGGPEPGLRSFQLVVAAGRAWGIGRGGGLPWRLAGDMAHFKAVTSTVDAAGLGAGPSSSSSAPSPPSSSSSLPRRNAVVMGRATWESLPAKARPLPGRLNVVLSRSAAAGAENSGGSGNGAAAAKSLALPDGVLLAGSLEGALATLAAPPHADSVERVFVIGGAQVYKCVQVFVFFFFLSDACARARFRAIHLSTTPPPPPNTHTEKPWPPRSARPST